MHHSIKLKITRKQLFSPVLEILKQCLCCELPKQMLEERSRMYDGILRIWVGEGGV